VPPPPPPATTRYSTVGGGDVLAEPKTVNIFVTLALAVTDRLLLVTLAFAVIFSAFTILLPAKFKLSPAGNSFIVFAVELATSGK
jgi:hypothetical protein